MKALIGWVLGHAETLAFFGLALLIAAGGFGIESLRARATIANMKLGYVTSEAAAVKVQKDADAKTQANNDQNGHITGEKLADTLTDLHNAQKALKNETAKNAIYHTCHPTLAGLRAINAIDGTD